MRIKRQKERGSTGNQTGSQANEEPGEPVPIQGPEGKQLLNRVKIRRD
jgi:hypothetical protein